MNNLNQMSQTADDPTPESTDTGKAIATINVLNNRMDDQLKRFRKNLDRLVSPQAVGVEKGDESHTQGAVLAEINFGLASLKEKVDELATLNSRLDKI